MPPFKKSGGFGAKRSFDRPRFGGGERSGGFNRDRGGDRDRRPAEMFSATCSTCGKQCEVPFRPTGDRPVFCRDCFQAKGAVSAKFGGDRPKFNNPAPSYQAAPAAPFQAQPRPDDKRINELNSKIDAMTDKLNKLIQLVERSATPFAPAAAPAPKATVTAAPAAAPAKVAATKPIAAKPAMKKAVAKAAPKVAAKKKAAPKKK